jgi:hypothetical protein
LVIATSSAAWPIDTLDETEVSQQICLIVAIYNFDVKWQVRGDVMQVGLESSRSNRARRAAS